MTSSIYEYIWLDGDNQLRSKVRVIDTKQNVSLTDNSFPQWNYDGSSTNQANSDGNTEVILKPIRVYHNHLSTNSFFVLCETFNIDGTPHETNSRHKATQIFSSHQSNEKPWFGLEQEYFMINVNKIDKKDNEYYCGVSLGNIQRKIAEEHLNVCIQTGLKISGINAEVSPCQWEFQIGPCEGINSGDHMTMARFLLERIAEKYDVSISYEPKPIEGINGSGCHINFSTENTRNKINEKTGKTGLSYIYDYIDRLKESHSDLIRVYGKNNHMRLTGKNETSSHETFSSGVGTRNTSIRIPNETHQTQCGYLEDRRPGSNIDPYEATSLLFKKCVN